MLIVKAPILTIKALESPKTLNPKAYFKYEGPHSMKEFGHLGNSRAMKAPTLKPAAQNRWGFGLWVLRV